MKDVIRAQLQGSRSRRRAVVLGLCLAGIFAWGCAQHGLTPNLIRLEQQVMEAERAFAQAMADRDHAAFTALLSDEAVFFSGEEPIRGKQAVAAAWKPFFQGLIPPFSWEPERVEVLESGSLALSTGPVRDPEGKLIGRFNSIWREETPGRWRVVFDKGSPVCGTPPVGNVDLQPEPGRRGALQRLEQRHKLAQRAHAVGGGAEILSLHEGVGHHRTIDAGCNR